MPARPLPLVVQGLSVLALLLLLWVGGLSLALTPTAPAWVVWPLLLPVHVLVWGICGPAGRDLAPYLPAPGVARLIARPLAFAVVNLPSLGMALDLYAR